MDIYGFVSSIVSSIVWPIVVLVVLFVLKKPLSQLLLGLRNLKYNSLEMNFGKELTKLEQSLDKESQSDLHNPKSEIKHEKENDIKAVAEISPGAAITMTWSMLEEEIVKVIKRLGISPDYPPYNSTLKNINLLKDNGFIDIQTYEVINEIRQIRNKATHTNEQLSYLDAIKYYEIAIKLVDKLKQIKR